MIENWRKSWNQGEFPFYFCQLANFEDKSDLPGDSAWAELRDAQNSALTLPSTGRAVLIDVGEASDIHPRNKKDVGERLAEIALRNDYGVDVKFEAPSFLDAQFEEGYAVVRFKLHGDNLITKKLADSYSLRTVSGETAKLTRNSPNSEVEGFAICGADRKWFWADARIKDDSVVVSSPHVPQPVAVRYGWQNNPTCNLYGASGLPVSPFRTDDFPFITVKETYR